MFGMGTGVASPPLSLDSHDVGRSTFVTWTSRPLVELLLHYTASFGVPPVTDDLVSTMQQDVAFSSTDMDVGAFSRTSSSSYSIEEVLLLQNRMRI